jgi:hypothetical protein
VPTDLGDYATLLRFLAAAMLLLVLPVAADSAAQAVAALAVAVLAATVAALIGTAGTRAAAGSLIGGRDGTGAGPVCRHSDPDSAGHVQARAPGLAIRSA